MKEISGNEATIILRRTGQLENVHVVGILNMLDVADMHGKYGPETVEKSIQLKNCQIENYYSPCLLYDHRVVWEKCTFEEVQVYAAYFCGGLIVKDCEFLSEFQYGAAGHNSEDAAFLFERVKFHKFADFFDCWFRGPVVLRDVEFSEGTNLMHEDAGWVSFEVPPILERITGRVDCPYNLEHRNGETRLVHWRDGHGAMAIYNNVIPRTRKISYAILAVSIPVGLLALWALGPIAFLVILALGAATCAFGLATLQAKPNIPTFVLLGKTRLRTVFLKGKDRIIKKENIVEVRPLAGSKQGCLVALDGGEEVVLNSIEFDVVQKIRQWVS